MTKCSMVERVFFFILFGITALLVFFILLPYANVIFISLIFTVLFMPLFDRILRWLSGGNKEKNRGFASLLTVTAIGSAIFIPVIALGYLLSLEVIEVYKTIRSGGGLEAIDRFIVAFENAIRRVSPAFNLDIDVYQYLGKFLRWLVSNLNKIFSGTATFFLDIFLIMMAMFFLFRDGYKLREFAFKWSPLADIHHEIILARVRDAIAAVVKGTLATAMAQGALTGIGFAIFGVPNPVLWGAIATIAAVIPILGTGIVSFPAIVWLLIVGHLGSAIGLAVWAVAVVGLVDNFIKPYMINYSINIHPFLILLSILGGLISFGPIGFLAGPVILALFFAILDIWPQIIKDQKPEKNSD